MSQEGTNYYHNEKKQHEKMNKVPINYKTSMSYSAGPHDNNVSYLCSFNE